MKRIFLDTNFLLDYFIREEYYLESEKLLIECKKRKYKFFISYLTVANFAYVVRKMPKEVMAEMIGRICSLFNVVDNNRHQIISNIEIMPDDFEDGLQYQAALEAGCDCIITRNQKDFVFSKIPIMSTSEFLNYLSTQ